MQTPTTQDNEQQPFVSEAHEGSPAFEWVVALCVVVCAVTALAGHVIWAVGIMAVTAIGTAAIRLIMRERSPWKIRSVGFDCFFGFALGVGLLITVLSIFFLEW